MKIATFNVNGINARLPRLIEWLEEAKPDVVCLQELKADDEKFPLSAIRDAGYGAVWHGQKGFNGVAILARGRDPVEIRRGLPDDPDPSHSRYIEAEVDGVVVGSIYLPNGNPQPGPKFEYKLAWFDRLIDHAATLFATEKPVVLAGDYNVIPTETKDDVFSARAMASDALMQPETRAGPSTPSGIIRRERGLATRASASIICCCHPSRPIASPMPASTRPRAARRKPAITRQPGSRSAEPFAPLTIAVIYIQDHVTAGLRHSGGLVQRHKGDVPCSRLSAPRSSRSP
jgi:exodeoxyribonuclease III